MEVVELDRKLRDNHPGVKIPATPIDPASIIPPPKRKSNFLNTLSRLASPTSNKALRNRSSSRQNGHSMMSSSTTLPTPPLTSPSSEANDPFTAIEPAEVANATPTSPSATSTAIAAYLTTIANMAAFRKDRVWKRFVRVRTDDLESVRVERAIKRVRSDLAAHVGGLGNVGGGGNRASVLMKDDDASERANQTGDPARSLPSPEDDDDQQSTTDTQGEPREGAEDEEEAGHARDATAVPQEKGTEGEKDGENEKKVATGDDESVAGAEAQDEDVPSTPVNEHPSAAHARNMPRSQSADPDKSHRMSRVYASSVSPSQDGMSSQVEETGDESSFSVNGSRRRQRKKKVKKTPSKKVGIEDFEMMRVLGKGCAGKVLLVRHKNTTGLFALKAITKRHVLAHQELQHTLTEQAVLKRMAAESKDPFVVKLWWSFHDKENLFLVMVRFHLFAKSVVQ